jgi:hypothetical protein
MSMNSYSPVLSIATALIEITAAVWVFSGRGRRRFTRPAGLILLLLAGYQIAEAVACSNTTGSSAARAGFLDILWLPVVGVILVFRLSDLPKRTVAVLSSGLVAVAVCLAVWILLEPDFARVSVCTVVLARYENPEPLYRVFGAFYHSGIACMLIGSATIMAGLSDEVRRRHLADILIGTLSFVLPAMLLQVIVPAARGALPSLMCHFALIFALFLVRLVRREQKTG